ncbi:nucleoside diphosphate kinase [Anoxybacillus tepidamans]|uniref:Nucleoside diphosphate kinase n=1 Tax=Anoxybacteroides tepidamans TaxID=265948 RepID=A0A7W8IMH8_9BACL|nr:hypothetical protein [Anoxybacillus tepidamans]MBB5323346.1 nucleoside diphosphate kinase [Anoxybacillus tepidamans]
MEDHLHGAVNRQKKDIRHVIEKFQKRGIKISACKPRAMISPSCLATVDVVKNNG